MLISATYETLRQIAAGEFDDIVVYAEITRLLTGDPLKLRLNVVDGSFIDVYISVTGRYSYHWERRFTGKNELYRHDNAPHKAWRHISTYPRHFHDGQEERVVASTISPVPNEALREFCQFTREKLWHESSENKTSQSS